MNHRISPPQYIPEWDKFHFTDHVHYRMAQRNLSKHDLRFVLQFGQRFRRNGVIFVFLRGRDIPNHKLVSKHFDRLEGTVVVLSRENPDRIITAYRDRQNGMRRIRRNKKQRRRYS